MRRHHPRAQPPRRHAARPRMCACRPPRAVHQTSTFACHRSPGASAMSCFCPCVQFGLNQRLAFQASPVKWALLWIFPAAVFFSLWLAFAPIAPSNTIVEVDGAVAECEPPPARHPPACDGPTPRRDWPRALQSRGERCARWRRACWFGSRLKLDTLPVGRSSAHRVGSYGRERRAARGVATAARAPQVRPFWIGAHEARWRCRRHHRRLARRDPGVRMPSISSAVRRYAPTCCATAAATAARSRARRGRSGRRR